GPSERTLTPVLPVGISSMPDQYVNLQLSKGFTFNLMCVAGASGIGKTSLFRTLFRQPLIGILTFTQYKMTRTQIAQKTCHLLHGSLVLLSPFLN
ncbi:hypothetical protein MXB_4041, partial [Myxobolus squamalis]